MTEAVMAAYERRRPPAVEKKKKNTYVAILLKLTFGIKAVCSEIHVSEALPLGNILHKMILVAEMVLSCAEKMKTKK